MSPNSFIRYFVTAWILTVLSQFALSIPQQELGHPLNGGNGRIYGGEEATPNEFPWMAYVRVYKAGSNETVGLATVCGGSLLSSRYVLTYATCIWWNEMEYIQVILGAHDLSKPTEPSRVSVNSNQYFLDDSRAYLLLILLPSPVIFTPQIQPIALPSIYDSYSPEETVKLIGWSESSENSGAYNAPLRKVDVKLIANEMCGLASNNDKYFCTSGEGGKGTCVDNGGPVNYKRTNGNWTLMGVITGANVPCGNGGPSYHIDVKPFLEWIYKTTGMTNPDPNPTSAPSTAVGLSIRPLSILFGTIFPTLHFVMH